MDFAVKNLLALIAGNQCSEIKIITEKKFIEVQYKLKKEFRGLNYVADYDLDHEEDFIIDSYDLLEKNILLADVLHRFTNDLMDMSQ